MATYRQVDIRLWNDRKFLALNNDGRLLWLFLLTTRFAVGIPGVVITGDAAIAEELDWKPDRLKKAWTNLVSEGLSFRRDGRLIWLANAFKYQKVAGPKAIVGMFKVWDNVPDGDLKLEILESLIAASSTWSQVFGEVFAEPLRQREARGIRYPIPCATPRCDPQEQDQEQDQEQEQEREVRAPSAPLSLELFKSKVDAAVGDIGKRRARKPKPSEPTSDERAAAMRILGKLTERNGVAYSGAKAHLDLIVARLRSGIPEMELRYVIAYCAAERGWATDPKMVGSLRPETLFGPETVWRYLDPARAWVAKLPADDQPQTGAA